MKFTKEEISLCKQVAEKHRKEIKVGDYVMWAGRHCLVIESGKNYNYIAAKWLKGREQRTVSYRWIEQEYALPLWTISDCLKFLRKKCQDHVLLIHEKGLEEDEEWYLWFDEYKETQQWGKGKTPLEACLKAILAVLEEGK